MRNAHSGGAISRTLNITTATMVRVGPGRLFRVNVISAGSAIGAVYDAPDVNSNTAANQIGVIPMVAGSYDLECPLSAGLLVVPGAGQVLAVTFT